MLRAIGRIRHRAKSEEIARLEQRDGVIAREADARTDLLCNRNESGIANRLQVDVRCRGGHGGQSSRRLIARVTLCPPKPKLLLSTARTGRLTAELAV